MSFADEIIDGTENTNSIISIKIRGYAFIIDTDQFYLFYVSHPI